MKQSLGRWLAGLLALAGMASLAPAQKQTDLFDLLDGEKGRTDLSSADFGAAVPRRIAIEPGTARIAFPFKAADAGGAFTWTLVWDNGKKTDIPVKIGDGAYKVEDKSASAPPESTLSKVLPDACLEMPSLKFKYYTRPNPEFFNEGEVARLQARWLSYPDAAAHPFRLALEPRPGAVGLSLDGQYVGEVKGAGQLKEVVFPLPAATPVTVEKAGPWSPWLPLDLSRCNRPGAMVSAAPRLDAAAASLFKGPLRLEPDGLNADVGSCRDVSPPVDYDSSIYRYYERSAFEGLPESLLFSVPAAPYARAWVLCALEDNAVKEPSFNVRLTRYRRGGIGNAIITTRVDLPAGDQPAASNLVRAGSVEYGPAGARKTAVLWLAEVPLNSGEIQDVVYSDWAGGRLDVELLGLARQSKSGVHVFAATLERSPVAMEVRQTIQGSVFHNDEKPEMRVELRPAAAAEVVLRWRVEDVWGAEAARGEQAFSFREGAEPLLHPVSLAMPDFGWYKVAFSLHEPGGRLLTAHTASYAQLPPDTRKAGYESPYGCWWQQYLHSHMTNPAVIGPLLFKAGIRRTTGTCGSEEAMKTWKVTIGMIPWLSGWHPPGTPAPTVEEWKANYEKAVAEHLRRFPNTGLAMIFHESYGETWLAPEHWGGKPTPFQSAALVHKANLASSLLREKYPDLKIIVGNSGWSGGLMSQLFRGGFSTNAVDALGMERLLGYFGKDSMPPERHEASWSAAYIGRLYGTKARPSDCYESGGRGDYGLTQRQIAEYVVRDSLVGHAWNYLYIGLGTFTENVNGYYHTRWGGDAILRRTPLLYPQPQYVAIATMTRALDSARPVRRVPTGSHTAYALEFARADGERVYALWTPRGSCALTLRFPKDGAVELTGHYGKTRKAEIRGGVLAVEAGEEVTYLTAPFAAGAIEAGARAFPADTPPAHARVVDPLADAAAWGFASSKAFECGPMPYAWLPWRVEGKGRLEAAADPEKGNCLALELVAEGTIPEMLGECLTLAPRVPVSVPGKPDTLGVWVRGNSGWGRVMMEIRDAEGERFLGGTYLYEPRGTTYLNFDGWNFIAFPLTEEAPARKQFYYNTSQIWRGNGGNGRIDYPVEVTGLTFDMRRLALDLAEMAPVAPRILLKDLTAFGSDPAAVPVSAATAGTAPGPAPDAQVLFRDEDLAATAVGARPAIYVDGAVVREEGGQRYAAFDKGVNGLFRYLRYYGSANWLDSEWRFRFRFPEAGRIGFQVLLRTGFDPVPFIAAPVRGAEDMCKGVSLSFTREGLRATVVDGLFEMEPGPSWTDRGLAPLEAGRWYTAVIRTAGRALDVALEEEGGKRTPVYRGPIPAGGGGVSLSSTNPIHLAGMVISRAQATAEDWNHAGRILRQPDPAAPGGEAVRIDGPFLFADTVAVDSNRPCLLSVSLRSERGEAPAVLVIGDHRKEVVAGPEWRRYAFMAPPRPISAEDPRCLFAVKGSAEGALFAAAPRVDYAKVDPAARRAEGWVRSLERDYEVDGSVFREGKCSLKLEAGGQAVQEQELAREDFRPLALGAWHKGGTPPLKGRLQLELFRDRKYWTPATPNEIEPRETFELELKPSGGAWSAAETKITPRNAFKRFRLTVAAEGAGGALWLDSLALNPIGAAGTPAAPGPSPADLMGERKEAVDAMDEEIRSLAAARKEPGKGENLLRNPGFEEPMTNGVVTRASEMALPPAPAGSNTWFSP